MLHETIHPRALSGPPLGRSASSCVGRHQLVDTIEQLVLGDPPVVVNVTGPRWIGKTGVLRCLVEGRARSTNDNPRPADGKVLFIYVDLHKEAPGAANPFSQVGSTIYERLQSRPDVSLRTVLTELGSNGAAAGPSWKSTERALARLAEAVEQSGLRLVICIDHLDKIPQVDEASNLRALEILTDVASLVLATRRTLTDISPGLSASPFVHKSIIFSLGLLEEEAAKELIGEVGAEKGVTFKPEDMDWLIKLAGRHPYILWKATARAADLLQESSAAAPRKLTANDVRALIEPSLRPLFEALWQENQTYLRLSQELEKKGDAAKNDLRAVRQELQRAALIYENPENDFDFKYFSPLFESFVIGKLNPFAPAEAEPAARRPNLGEMLAILDVRQGTKEHDVLRLLVERAGEVIGDEQLLTAVWGEGGSERAMVTTISRLRGKLEQHQRQINGQIVRVRSQGYTFEWRPSKK